jgi:hypothetical protein
MYLIILECYVIFYVTLYLCLIYTMHWIFLASQREATQANTRITKHAQYSFGLVYDV